MSYFNVHLNLLKFCYPGEGFSRSNVSECQKVGSKLLCFFFFSPLLFLSFDTFSSQTLSKIISPFQQDAERDILRVPGKRDIHNV